MAPNPKQALGTHGRELSIDARGAELHGTLVIPSHAQGLVLFAHGSGSSRHSPRNQFVARELQSKNFATLLFDLLTREEESADQLTGEFRFDIPFLAQRLVAVTRFVLELPEISALKLGYFGASTGAAAALVAAAELRDEIKAIVSRGGRPDLARDALGDVRAPTLLIVGGNDEPVIEMNESALAKLASSEKQLILVPGATHLFEEPGKLEIVAQLAADWFARYLSTAKNL